MTKKPKAKPDLPEALKPDSLPVVPNGVFEVMLYTYHFDEPICGHCHKEHLILRDKDIMIRWLDGGFTYVPLDSVVKLHWEEVQIH